MTALSSSDRTRPDGLPAFSGDRLLRSVDVATLLGVTTRTVRRLGANGEIPRITLGTRSTRYRLTDVLAFIESRTSEAAPTGGSATTREDDARHDAE